ncbi:MAG: hypothetical protein ACRCX2_36435 [Paraclostridium sp.]
MSKSTAIFNIYRSKKSTDRDERVVEKISIYFKNNISAITDGIINDVPKISAEQRDIIAREYNISDSDWAMIKKVPEFKNMKQLASPLNLGLLISYIETKNKVFLTYLFILHYSSIYMKYMTKGSHNAMVMKYTIDTADNRTDFKRYECSLIAVVNKKIESFIDNYKTILSSKAEPTDTQLRELLQASKTRLNEMFKTLYGKYKANMNSDNVKVMMEYSETSEGKHVLSMQNVFEKLKEVSSESLFSPSEVVLNRIGLSTSNMSEFKYRLVIIRNFNKSYSILSGANSLIIDKWVSQNINRMTMDNFKTTFIKTMMNGRNIKHIYEAIDGAVDLMIAEEGATSETYNKIVLRNYIYKYLVLNIYQSSMKIFHN